MYDSHDDDDDMIMLWHTYRYSMIPRDLEGIFRWQAF